MWIESEYVEITGCEECNAGCEELESWCMVGVHGLISIGLDWLVFPSRFDFEGWGQMNG